MPDPPVVRPLPSGFSLVEAFRQLATQPGCLWLDSASPGPETARQCGRYSFLMADPIEVLSALPSAPNPWPQLRRWAEALPQEQNDELPPFQGGIAGLIGYEAATWLEPVPVSKREIGPAPALSVGLYDWTIAVDHFSGHAWLISQGFGATDRWAQATDRADQVLALLSKPSRTIKLPINPDNLARPPEHFSATDHADVWSNFTSHDYRAAVTNIIDRIRRGDSFQVNLAQQLLTPATSSPTELYLRLRRASPAPYSGYFAPTGPAVESTQVLSSSMEGFLRIRGPDVETRPIKGTVQRTGIAAQDNLLANELLASEKDRAENTMIVDLMRNDLSRFCADESVIVEQWCGLETYAQVQHLVSVITGRMLPGTTAVDALQACFPGGSVTGAPKIEAMRTIAELEPHRRGAYCGALGYISGGGCAEFNILIRTITAAGGYWQIPVGGGITARSDPAAEEAETWAKAAGMLGAVFSDNS